MNIAYYDGSIAEFTSADPAAIFGALAQNHGFALEHQQRAAWKLQIELLREALALVGEGYVLMEVAIPRIGKRADVVLLVRNTIVILEFKVGASSFDPYAIEQVHDYALDLKNFHRGSHGFPIVPVVVATEAKTGFCNELIYAFDGVAQPVLLRAEQLSKFLEQLSQGSGQVIDVPRWMSSGYEPTPTIVEAAQALYRHHSVAEISRSDAGAANLKETADQIAAVIDSAKAGGRKAICFVTGVPGAGKTLAGLNIATKRSEEHSDEHAVFLSGNGPLVTVLREALARDEAVRDGTPKKQALRKVSSFIQNIHHFRDDALRNTDAPYEKVAIFDEAQRAWSRDQTEKFMKAKRNYSSFDMSEPEFLISVMDRHEDWCVIVCLVGGGQEINTGEAGLAEWLIALNARFAHWDVYVSDRLGGGDYPVDEKVTAILGGMPLQRRPGLHLGVSMRSFRAEALSTYVSHIVENRLEAARELHPELVERYPMYLTRDLEAMRRWLRCAARGSERFGLVASSGAYRLRPEGLQVAAKVQAEAWFLNDRTDVRSSFYLEEVATEFDVQGLELDWVGVCWDGDFRYFQGEWTFNRFSGSKWQRVIQSERQHYLRNAYRVIMTRARQGMVIFVPRGDANDPTRPPTFYDETFACLKSCGIRELPSPQASVSTSGAAVCRTILP